MTEQTQTKNSLINSLSVKHGLLIGVVAIVLNAALFVIDPVMQFTAWWLSILILIIIIVLLVLLGIDVRKKIGGYWTFGEAFKSLFIMGVILSVMTIVYNFVIFKYVDPQLPEKANAALLESLTTRLSNANLSQDQIDQYTKTFQNGEFIAKIRPTLANELKAFVTGLIMHIIIALIIAACIKKKAPVTLIETDPTPEA
ncbi:MAG TPA: DUF4199 domain-containing protein [Mucilaginibacter sp.]|nr:DUF4199 domain-containing protein [Mucilaginibacter sp.]